MPKKDTTNSSIIELQINDLMLSIKQELTNNPFYLDLNHNLLDDFKKSRGPLRGMLFDIKLNFLTKDYKSDCASAMLQNYQASYNCEVYNIMIRNGAIMIGKTNCDEFAAGSLGVNSVYGPVFYQNCYTGGSSSGAGYAAKKCAKICFGTDTGGSVRLPAMFTRVFAYKPSFGAISRYGIVEYSKGLDTVGCLFRNPADMIKVFNYVVQHDFKDSMSNSIRKKNIVDTIKIIYPKLFNEYELPILEYLKNNLKYEESNITFNSDVINAIYDNRSCMDIFSECFKFDTLRFVNNKQHNIKDLDNYTSDRYKMFGSYLLEKFSYGALLLSDTELKSRYYFSTMKAISQIMLTLNKLTQDSILVFPSRFPDIELTEAILKLANLGGLPSIVIPIKDDIQYPSSVPLKYSGVILIGGYHKDLALLSIANQYYKQNHNQ